MPDVQDVGIENQSERNQPPLLLLLSSVACVNREKQVVRPSSLALTLSMQARDRGSESRVPDTTVRDLRIEWLIFASIFFPFTCILLLRLKLSLSSPGKRHVSLSLTHASEGASERASERRRRKVVREK